ncbi:MAG TPA: sulfotransferase [Thermoanaerobaculia bacterium]|nr:sulfotransferase [Thermoanaerobaculia bacterium]
MICIAGMPRSGTSLVTQLLHQSGLYLGAAGDMMPASPNNTDGFWENLLFVRVNERLLAASGGTWFAPPDQVRPTPAIVGDARAAMARFAGREPWGWKDPRNALTLSFWRGLLPPTLKVIVCVRHPAETAASLAASTLFPRPGFRFSWPLTRGRSLHRRVAAAIRATASAAERSRLNDEVGLDLWRIYNTALLEQCRGLERLITHYEAILDDPRGELERLLDFAGLPVSSAAREQAVAVTKRSLRHQRVHDAPLDPALASLYAQLCAESATREPHHA